MVCVVCLNPAFAQSKDLPAVSHDGLELVEDSEVDILYVLPEADFSGYTKVMVLEAHIAFKKNWQRDQNRSRTRRVSDKDMARMIERGKDLFDHVFTDELEEGGYEVVKQLGEDVLLLRPAIIDLDVTAPDINTPGRSRTYIASSGGATLFIELYDSITSQILARAFDRKTDRDTNIRWSMGTTSVSNTQDATRALKHWAGLLVDGLDRAKGGTE